MQTTKFRTYINRFKLTSRARFALCISALLWLLSACYDDTFDSFLPDDNIPPYICFSIESDTATVASRSGKALDEAVRNIYTIESEQDTVKLYLIESETEGINLDCYASRPTRSRGTVITNSDSLKTLGLYCFPSPKNGIIPVSDTILKFNHWKLKNEGTGFPGIYDQKGNLRAEEKWPGYPLDFVAYYPYTAAFSSESTTTESTDENAQEVAQQVQPSAEEKYREQLYSWVWNNNENGLRLHPTPRNGMYLYYKVPDEIGAQQDLMADYIQNQTHSPVKLQMKHLLSAIRFETGDDLALCTIKKISLAGVRNNGYLNVTSLINGTEKTQWWVDPDPEPEKNENPGNETSTQSEEGTEGEQNTESEAKPAVQEKSLIDYLDLKRGAIKRTSYTFVFKDGLTLVEDTKKPGQAVAGQPLLGEGNEVLLLMPQKLNGKDKVTLYVELEYEGNIYKRLIDLQGEWKPGCTYTYRLNSKSLELPIAELYLTDENGMLFNEIRVGFAGGETNYKVGSYIYYKSKKDWADNKDITKLPMPWKASIVAVDETGKETPIIWDEFKIKTSKAQGPSSGKGTLGWIRTDWKTDGYVNGIKNNDKTAFTDNFGDIERIEYEHYNANFIPESGLLADNPVRTFVTIPRISMSSTSSATAYMQGLDEVGSVDAPYNLAARGIGLTKNGGLKIFNKGKSQATEQLEREYENTEDYYGKKDINTANCYIVSAPGWYTIPLVYGNAVKDGYVNYGAYVFKSKKDGESYTDKSDSLKGENQILQYAIRHDGKEIKAPYILDERNIGKENPDIKVNDLEAKLLWEDQVCLIEDVDLVDASDQKLGMFKNNGNAPQGDVTYSPQKKIRFHIQKDNIRQGNAVIVLKEKDTGDVIWSWHIWVTPDGTGTASNYHPVSHKSTIYGAYYQHGHETDSYKTYQDVWEDEIHNHYIYNRCIGLVMAGDKYDFTPPKNIYIKYEPVYEALYTRLTNNNCELYQKIYGGSHSATSYINEAKGEVKEFIDSLKVYYGEVGTGKRGTHPVYVKVNQADLSCSVDEDYYMLYQWGRKDPMITRFENIYDGNHCVIDPADKRHLGEHHEISDHTELIKYGIKHPDECIYNGGIGSGTFYANLWDFSLGKDEINCIYPEDNKTTNFFEEGTQNTVTEQFYYGSDRVFKSVYDPSPVGQKIPVGTVLNMLITDDKMLTDKSGQHTVYKYEFTTYSGYGHSGTGMGGLFTLEYQKDEDGNHITLPEPHSFWIPAFGYRYGNGFMTNHGNEFVIWEGGPLNREGNGHVLFGNYSNVHVSGKEISKYSLYMSLPVLPMFDEPQWIRTW